MFSRAGKKKDELEFVKFYEKIFWRRFKNYVIDVWNQCS
jgi:hypothetical protein